MRSLAVAAPALLAACAAAPPLHGETPGRICSAARTSHFIGQPGTSDSGAAILRETNSAVLRWAPPGTMLTMDYSPSRVTVRLDASHRILSINCG